jgi:hypothetical protein
MNSNEFHQKAMIELRKDESFDSSELKSEEEMIREVAEEEGMTVEEVREIWDTFKAEARGYVNSKKKATKSKFDKSKSKTKKKQAKKSRKRNR